MSMLPAMAEKAVAFRASRRSTGLDEPGLYCIPDPMEVARLLIEAGEGDPFLLAAAVLHDLLQSAGTTEADIAAAFGAETAFIVAEATDHPQLSVSTRKVLRMTLAPHMSRKSRLLKLAQLAVSARTIGGPYAPPAWKAKQALEYLDWIERFADLVGVPNPTLQAILLAELEGARLNVGARLASDR
ncbi:MAG: HD domain-containing protein [Burkholderiaceae bacterium]|nr:HD domain-containing protein [Burkholderiaceae bacterium]